MIQVFASQLIKKQLSDRELKNLLEDFRQYKQTGVLPDTFGRDVPYDHPSNLPLIRSEEVQHLHLKPSNTPEWPVRLAQFRRTSDVHLVYCQGASNIQCYYLMLILAPDAHQQASDNNMMFKLGSMAERFRLKY